MRTSASRELIDGARRLRARRRGRSPATAGTVDPGEDEVTGFVFKVQANMDPQHRDRIAFMRLFSGTFRRGMKLNMVRHRQADRGASPILFFAQDREIAEEA